MTTNQRLKLMKHELETHDYKIQHEDLMRRYLMLSQNYARDLSISVQVDLYQQQFSWLFDALCCKKKPSQWRKLCKSAIDQPIERLSVLLQDKVQRKELKQIQRMFDEIDEHYFIRQ